MSEEHLSTLRKAYSDIFKLLFDIRHNLASSAWYEATDKQEFVNGEHVRINGIEKFVYQHRNDITTLLASWEEQQNKEQS